MRRRGSLAGNSDNGGGGERGENDEDEDDDGFEMVSGSGGGAGSLSALPPHSQRIVHGVWGSVAPGGGEADAE